MRLHVDLGGVGLKGGRGTLVTLVICRLIMGNNMGNLATHLSPFSPKHSAGNTSFIGERGCFKLIERHNRDFSGQDSVNTARQSFSVERSQTLDFQTPSRPCVPETHVPYVAGYPIPHLGHHLVHFMMSRTQTLNP